MKKKTIAFIIIDLVILSCFFLLYGPFKSFTNLIVSTVMVTKTHQYIAYTFYSEETVRNVLYLNSYTPLTDDVNLKDIVIDTSEKESYDNEYDEAILTRDENSEDYKLLNVKVGKYDAYLVAIYDPSKVKLITSRAFNTGSGNETVTSICNRVGAIVGINGGGFQDPLGWGSDIPTGVLIKDGKVIWSDTKKATDLIGFNEENKLVLVTATADEALDMGIRDALNFGPFLIVNGEKLQFNSAAGGYDRAARVAIGQRKDGVVLFLVTDGIHSNGPNLGEMVETLAKYGAYNAANLDGGSSTQLVINGKLVNNPKNVFGKAIVGGRRVVSGFGLIP